MTSSAMSLAGVTPKDSPFPRYVTTAAGLVLASPLIAFIGST